MSDVTFYDPHKTFEDNFDNGPFGDVPQYTKPEGEPQYTVLGKKVYLPFGIPAGPLPTSKHTSAAFACGFDVVCYKTQRSTSFEPNQFPHVLSVQVDGDLTLEKAQEPLVGSREFKEPFEKLTITNSFGNPSRGPRFWVDDLKEAIAATGEGQLLIMSVVGTIKDGFSQEDYYRDFAETAKLAAEAGAEAIEVNLSCPNVASEGVLCYSPEAVTAICKLTREAIGDTPLVAKLGYFSPEQQPVLEQVVAGIAPYVQAISAINTIAAPVVDENGDQALPGEGRLKSGTCGTAIRWAGLDLVARLKALRDEKSYTYEIFGVGGVKTPEDYKAYIAAGADCVQSATGAMWNSDLATEIKASA